MNLRVDLYEGGRIALKSLRAHRLRTVLTTLGIGIGVATLLAILGITQGLDSSFQRQLASLGSSSLFISKHPWVSFGNWWEYRNRKPVTLAQLEAVGRQCTLCALVVPTLDDQVDLSFRGRELVAVEVIGTTADWLQVEGYEVSTGRFLSASDNDSRRLTAVIGADIADTLFPLASPVGSTIIVSSRPFTVVGTLAARASSSIRARI